MAKDYTFNGRPIEVLREAKVGDPGYMPEEPLGNQLWVRFDDETEGVVQRPSLHHAGSEEAKLAAEQRDERDRVEEERLAAELEAMTPEQRAAHDRAEKARVEAMTPAQRKAHEAKQKHHAPARRKHADKMTYQGRAVTVVREAKVGDPGYDPAKTEVQSLIREADKTEKVVPRSALSHHDE